MKTIKILLVAAMVSVTLSCNSKTEAAKEKADMKQTAVEQPVAKAAQDSVNAEQEWLPTVIDFSATWCGPCRMQGPAVEKLAEEGYNVGKINVDDEGELAERYHVMNIPTLIIFKNGEEKERMVGVQSKDLLESKLKALA